MKGSGEAGAHQPRHPRRLSRGRLSTHRMQIFGTASMFFSSTPSRWSHLTGEPFGSPAC